MRPKEPLDESKIQMTPVGFAPLRTSDDIGLPGPAASREGMRFTLLLPVFIVIVTLNATTLRDIVALNKRMTRINDENAPSLELLKKSGKQLEFVQSMGTDLWKLAPTDPVAARLATEMFPHKPGETDVKPTDLLNAPAK